MNDHPGQDLTKPADLHRHHKGTGAKRTQIPVYQDYLPPCNEACPAGENIQKWLSFAQEGKFKKAWTALVEDNPFPAIMGRVCYHPCETSCNRTYIDKTVNIHAVERFLGDLALEKNWSFPVPAIKSGKRIMVVGAGPSGLAAAYHLVRLGHTVEIFEAGHLAGGMMYFGIPPYRLPRTVLDAETKRILDMGIEIHYNHKVEDLIKEQTKGVFDAVFIAVGAHISKKIDIPNRDAGKILDALSFLKEVESGIRPKLGRKVAIYGGGNTAMDAARSAKRLGYEPLIIYRRDREHMPAHDFEADEALAEGVKINWLRTIKEIDQTQFKVEVMKIDQNGRPQPTGKFETLEADALILALGQDTDTAFLKKVPELDMMSDGTVKVDRNLMSTKNGIFAGGDMVPSDRTVTVAVGHGKKAARCIDAWLRGLISEEKNKNPVIHYEKLNMWFKTMAPQRGQFQVPVEQRVVNFDEITSGLEPHEARYEAQRCLSCGNCFECDGCFGACPEDAIIKLGPGKRYEFNYELCTGCAVCFEQCPCHAIDMIPENEKENIHVR